jgi:hypothetical protein
MLTLKSKPTIDQLETAVSDRTRELAEARAAYREVRLVFEDAKTRYLESETPPRKLEYDASLTACNAASASIDAATMALEDATRALDIAQTGPQRQASAKRIDDAVAALRKAHPAVRLALASMCEALGAASFQEIAGVSQAGGLFSSWMHRANEAAVGGDLEKFIAELEAYRDGVLDGSKPATLAPTLHEQRSGLRKTA